MDAGWIDYWGEALERLSRRLAIATLGTMSLVLASAAALPEAGQVMSSLILGLVAAPRYSVTLPIAESSLRIAVEPVSDTDEIRYRRQVVRGAGTAETKLGEPVTWDGQTPLVIYAQGPDRVVIRQHHRGYDAYGGADARWQEPRRYLGMVRLERIKGRRQLLFLDGRATRECSPDGEVGPLPTCALSRTD